MSESLEHLSNNDSELTGKVAATYKQLGNLEQSYAALTNKSAKIKQEIDTVSKTLADLSDKSSYDIQRLNEGYNELETINNKLTSIDDRMEDMDDSLASLDGRLNSQSPLRQFGGDNVIHGPQWLAKQTDPFIIQLTVVASKQALYDLARRYSSWLKDKISYMPAGADQYVLFYGGFQDLQQAQLALTSLPHYIKFDRPVIHRMIDVQAQLLSAR